VIEMKNPLITKDSYVDVSGWTESEVEVAAEIFSETLDVPIGNIEVLDRYHCLFCLFGDEVFVAGRGEMDAHNITKELTKDQVFSCLYEEQKIAVEIHDNFSGGAIRHTGESPWDVVEGFLKCYAEVGFKKSLDVVIKGGYNGSVVLSLDLDKTSGEMVLTKPDGTRVLLSEES